jgi:hypothetical protein
VRPYLSRQYSSRSSASLMLLITICSSMHPVDSIASDQSATEEVKLKHKRKFFFFFWLQRR